MIPNRVNASGWFGSEESTVHSVFSAPSNCPREISARALATGEAELDRTCCGQADTEQSAVEPTNRTANHLILLRCIAPSMAVLESLVDLHLALGIVGACLPAVSESELVVDVVALGIQMASRFQVGDRLLRIALLQLHFAQLIIGIRILWILPYDFI